jgi:uncharacterized protein (DUF488 family)
MIEIFTVGHSNYTLEQFLELLVKAGITTIIDVRSTPRSRYNPWVNKDVVGAKLPEQGIAYKYGGDVLGGFSPYTVNQSIFIAKINIAIKLAEQRPTALMCSERDPKICHRAYKLCSTIHRLYPDIKTTHILKGGILIDAREFEENQPYKFVADYHDKHLTN